MDWQTFFAVIAGAVVSGIIGIFTVRLTGSRRDRQWQRENIIRPLYNEVERVRISKGEEIDDKYHSFWTNLDSYTKLTVDEKLRKQLVDYTDIICQLKEALKRHEEIKQETIVVFADLAKRAMGKSLTVEGNDIILERRETGATSMDIRDFVRMFLEVLISHKGKAGYRLAEAMITKAESSHRGHERYLRLWQAQRLSVFVDLTHEFSSAEIPLEYNNTFNEVQTLRQKLILRTESLANRLLEKSKRHWLIG